MTRSVAIAISSGLGASPFHSAPGGWRSARVTITAFTTVCSSFGIQVGTVSRDTHSHHPYPASRQAPI